MRWDKYWLMWILLSSAMLSQSLLNDLNATICTTTSTTSWSCGTPSSLDTLVVNHNVTISGDFTLRGKLTISSNKTLTITGTFTARGSSTSIISGTLDVGDDMEIQNNAVVTVNNSGTLDVSDQLEVNGSSGVLNINSGSVVNVYDDLTVAGAGTINLNGTLNVDDDFTNDGQINGTGTATYGDCDGNGTINGTPSSEWCDDSGFIALGALPIELIWFKAENNGNFVDLSWSTASEINNDYFTIERSQDILLWEEIDLISGAGNSREVLVYNRADEKPLTGVSYYRLKQTDYDGKFSYSNIVSISNEGVLINIYPQPANDFVVFSLNENIKHIQIIDSQGLLIFKKRIFNQNTIEIDVSKYKSGMYFTIVSFDNYSNMNKFIIIK